MKLFNLLKPIISTKKTNINPVLFLSSNIKKNDICIDCGANIGLITEQMAKNGATVYAFEPNPFAFRELEKRINNRKNIHAFNKGVWDRNTRTKLYFHEYSESDEVKWSVGSSILEYKSNVLNEKYVDIEIIDLVEFIIRLNRTISILKIDIEGAECELLEKLIKTQTYKKIKQIYVETHDHKIPELKAKTDSIRKLIKEKKIKNINLKWI